MNCEDIRQLLPDYFSGMIDSADRKRIEEHLSACESCRLESESMNTLWAKLGDIPSEEPGAGSRVRFDAMLEAYSHGLEEQPGRIGFLDRIDAKLKHIIPSRPIFQAAAAVIFIVLGLFSGRMIENGRQTGEEVDRLRAEMSEMRQLLTVSLMNQPSAIDRLQGVTLSAQLASADDDVPAALIKVLNSDPNPNVRLAAIDQLARYQSKDWVRTELVGSLARKQPPAVQVFLIELLVDMQEKEAVEVFEALLEDEETMDVVKKRARKGIENII